MKITKKPLLTCQAMRHMAVTAMDSMCKVDLERSIHYMMIVSVHTYIYIYYMIYYIYIEIYLYIYLYTPFYTFAHSTECVLCVTHKSIYVCENKMPNAAGK